MTVYFKCQNNRVVRTVRSVNIYEIEAKVKLVVIQRLKKF